MFTKFLIFLGLLIAAAPVKPARADEDFLAQVRKQIEADNVELEKTKFLAEQNAKKVKSIIEGIFKTCQELREIQAALAKADEASKTTEAQLKRAQSLAAKLVTTSPSSSSNFLPPRRPRPPLLDGDRHREETPDERRARILGVCQEFLESQKEEIPPPPELRTPHDTTLEKESDDLTLYNNGENI